MEGFIFQVIQKRQGLVGLSIPKKKRVYTIFRPQYKSRLMWSVSFTAAIHVPTAISCAERTKMQTSACALTWFLIYLRHILLKVVQKRTTFTRFWLFVGEYERCSPPLSELRYDYRQEHSCIPRSSLKTHPTCQTKNSRTPPPLPTPKRIRGADAETRCNDEV